jgi:XTP/dITP diphosphohydrolase
MTNPHNDKDHFLQLLKIIKELREKCPWDKKQTINTLRHLTIEEVYELSDAILKNQKKNIEDELGDLLLHIMMYAEIGSEKKYFSINTIIKNLNKKLIHRHPHIYNKKNNKKITKKEVENSWEKIKLKEKGRKKILDGVPEKIPPMIKSMIIQKKVRNIGFDWENKNQVLEKIKEELKELQEETSKNKIKEEVGDLLFSVINYARFINIDPEEALELTNRKFKKRFNYLESEIKKEGKNLNKMSLNEMNVYWNKSKSITKN